MEWFAAMVALACVVLGFMAWLEEKTRQKGAKDVAAWEPSRPRLQQSAATAQRTSHAGFTANRPLSARVGSRGDSQASPSCDSRCGTAYDSGYGTSTTLTAAPRQAPRVAPKDAA